MANLKQGMSGNEVRDLQKKLIDAGYGDYLGKGQDDGIFGTQTAKAVKKYQEDHDLVADGIAGVKTLGSLNSAGSNKSNTGGNTNAGSNKIVAGDAKEPVAGSPKVEEPTTVTSPGGVTYGDFYYDEYDPMADEQIKQAWDVLNQHNATNPGEFTDPNGLMDTSLGYLNQYENRDPFSYDFNSDALYQQYKDQYIQQGQLAMMDTMGQAAAMTGGYGNSYAQTVGQQAYNQQLSQLNEIMPELYGMAYDRYNQEGQNMLDMYDAYLGLYQNAYSEHQNTLENWYRENSRLQGNYDTLYERGYDNYMLGYNTALNEYNTDRSEKFTISENEKSRADSKQASAKSDLINLITGTGYNPTDAELKEAGMTRDQAKSYAKAYEDSKVTGNNNNKPKEQTASQADIDSAIKRIERCENADQLASVSKALLAEGWSEGWVKIYVMQKDSKLTGGDKIDITVPAYTQVMSPEDYFKQQKYGGSSGSAGVSYWYQK